MPETDCKNRFGLSYFFILSYFPHRQKPDVILLRVPDDAVFMQFSENDLPLPPFYPAL